MNSNDYTYRTNDLSQAVALVVHGFLVRDIERVAYGNKAVFIFNRSKKLDTALSQYWADKLLVNPKSYFDAMKHLKTRIYSEA